MILFRILSAQPTTDGEKWKIKGSVHRDEWYTDAYGQDPAPFLRDPRNLSPDNRLPYPWNPDAEGFLSYDAIFPGAATMRLTVDRSAYPARITAGGISPVNLLPSSVFAPQVPADGSSSFPGGTFRPGTYYVAISWDYASGPISSLTRVVVPNVSVFNKLIVSGVKWPDAVAPTPWVFVGTSIMDMRSAIFVGSVNDSSGNPTTLTIANWPYSGSGIPDSAFQRFVMQQTPIAHSGVWGAAVTSASGADVTIAGAGWATNQWAGYTLSLFYRATTSQPLVNVLVSSNTADTLTMNHSGLFAADDVVVLRAAADYITDNTIGDGNFVNSFALTGLAVDGSEAGKIIRIIAGTGAGQPGKTVASNTSTVYTINGTWDVTPDSTSVWIVTDPSGKSRTGRVITNDGSGGAAVVDAISDDAPTTEAQSLLVEVATADIHGQYMPMRYQPFREVYVPEQILPSVGVSGLDPLVAVAGHVTPSIGISFVYEITLTGNIILDAAAAAPETVFCLKLNQDATGGRTVAFDAFYKGLSGFALDTTASTYASFLFLVNTSGTSAALLQIAMNGNPIA